MHVTYHAIESRHFRPHAMVNNLRRTTADEGVRKPRSHMCVLSHSKQTVWLGNGGQGGGQGVLPVAISCCQSCLGELSSAAASPGMHWL
jgi:hypothetical protein